MNLDGIRLSEPTTVKGVRLLAVLLATGTLIAGSSMQALGATMHSTHSTTRSAASGMGKGVIGIPSPCVPAAVRVRASLSSRFTALSGMLVVTNRSSRVCSLQGRPTVAVVDRSGHATGIPEHALTAPFMLDTVELVSGQRASAVLGWSNYCGSQHTPYHLQVRFPAWKASITAPIDVRPTSPACTKTRGRSAVFVGTMSPLSHQASDAIIIYYPFISNHRYDLAREYLSGKRPSLRALARQYRNTRRVNLQLLGVPRYRIARGHVTYSCVATEFVSVLRKGGVTQYGGWYMVASRGPTDHKLVLQGSQIRVAGIPEIPDRATCAAHIPK